jgi:prolyl-tRNA synthetase
MLGIKKDEDLSEWYSEILRLSDIIDKRYEVKGCFVWLPYGYKIMMGIKKTWDNLFQEAGIEEVYFPLLVPLEYAKINESWYEGFKNQAFWVTDHIGEEPQYILRPTGEPAIYPMYSLWIKTERLPIRLYETVSSFRYETKHTRPLIRDREITVWHEIHTVHATKEEAEKEMKLHIRLYDAIYKKLSIAPLKVQKPIWECFPGAVGAVEFYNIMPNGMAMENGSVNNLGQAYARKFDIQYSDEQGNKEYVWQICTGNGARLLAALILIHGDDMGLVIPPEIAPIKAVIVPIIYKGKEKVVYSKAKEICRILRESGIDAELDLSELTPGSKFYHWEVRGVPIRIEIGPRDVEKEVVILVRRDTGEKTSVKFSEIIDETKKTLKKIQANMLQRSKKELGNKIKLADTFDDIKDIIHNGKVAKTFWCTNKECYDKILELEPGFDPIGTDLEKSEIGKCVVCGRDTETQLYVARTY